MGTRNMPWEAKRAFFSAAKQKPKGDVIFACAEELNSKEEENVEKQGLV